MSFQTEQGNELRLRLLIQRELRRQQEVLALQAAEQAAKDLAFLGIPLDEVCKGAGIKHEVLKQFYHGLHLPTSSTKKRVWDVSSNEEAECGDVRNLAAIVSKKDLVSRLPQYNGKQFGRDRWSRFMSLENEEYTPEASRAPKPQPKENLSTEDVMKALRAQIEATKLLTQNLNSSSSGGATKSLNEPNAPKDEEEAQIAIVTGRKADKIPWAGSSTPSEMESHATDEYGSILLPVKAQDDGQSPRSQFVFESKPTAVKVSPLEELAKASASLDQSPVATYSNQTFASDRPVDISEPQSELGASDRPENVGSCHQAIGSLDQQSYKAQPGTNTDSECTNDKDITRPESDAACHNSNPGADPIEATRNESAKLVIPDYVPPDNESLCPTIGHLTDEDAEDDDMIPTPVLRAALYQVQRKPPDLAYKSPLEMFWTHRFSPLFLKDDIERVFSPTYNSALIENAAQREWCQNDLDGKSCPKNSCSGLHFSDWVAKPQGVLRIIIAQGASDPQVKKQLAQALAEYKKLHGATMDPLQVIKQLLDARSTVQRDKSCKALYL